MVGPVVKDEVEEICAGACAGEGVVSATIV